MKDKTILITGGNAGIGLATALAFADEGCNAAIFGRRESENEKARSAIEARGGSLPGLSG